MRKARDPLLSLTLVALVFAGPAALAAYFVAGDRSAPPLMLAAAGDGGSPGATAAAPVLAGVLYTKGSPQVDWNGVRAPISDGSYAYLGGEVVSSGTNDMSVLQLEGDNKVYMCPRSRMSLGLGDDGAYEITIYQGTGRFVFAAGTKYRIHANRSVYSPGADGASEATVVEVAVFGNHPGGVGCGFSGSLNVAGYPAEGGEPIALGTAGPGEVIDMSRALSDEEAASGAPVVVNPVPMPSSVQGWLRDNASYPPAPGPIGYLCRCEELKRYAEADGIPAAAITPLMLPPDTDSLAVLTTDDGTPVLPPPALALPDAPNPADPGVLNGDGPLTVPPPLVPIVGSGGGFTSTPS
jgi:hypothetical protein